MKLLLVEDDEELSSILTKGLKKCRYAVDAAYDGEDALSFWEINEYDLIILDLNLPKIDGLDVLKKIREKDMTMKVIILSARSEIEDRVLGLDMGANDYLVKPFDFMELEARIRTLLRMSFKQVSCILTYNGIKIDTPAKTASFNGEILLLTKKEYSILEYLMIHKECVISAEQLIEHVWDSDTDLFSNSLKFHIYSLKKKISDVSGKTELIKNIRGQGYILSEDCHEIIK
ncbi:MAG: response regulator transcription factor [Ruminiclostridium sp.]